MRERRKKAPEMSPRQVSNRFDTTNHQRPIELHTKARDAWIQHGTALAVREATGLSHLEATRIIDSGIPALGLPSLRDCARVHAAETNKRIAQAEKAQAALEGEKVAQELAKTLQARTEASRRAREHEAKVLGDAVSSRNDEVRLVRANRQSASALAMLNAHLLKGALGMSQSVFEDHAAMARMNPKQKISLIKDIAAITQRVAQASALAVNMERLLMGEPTAILGRADTGPSIQDMTPDQAQQWLDIANKAFAKKARRMSAPIDVSADAQAVEDESVSELLEEL